MSGIDDVLNDLGSVGHNIPNSVITLIKALEARIEALEAQIFGAKEVPQTPTPAPAEAPQSPDAPATGGDA
jgi:hypothetical protein